MKKTYRSAVVIGAILFSLFALAFFGRVSFSLPLLSILILLFLATKGTVIIWTIVVGLILEMVSPYPTFTYLFSLLTTVIVLRICMYYYLSHRTLLSAAVSGALGNLVFAFSLQGFSRLGKALSDGWIPALDRTFAFGLLGQTFAMAGGLVLLLAIFWRFSPGLRGVIINRGI